MEDNDLASIETALLYDWASNRARSCTIRSSGEIGDIEVLLLLSLHLEAGEGQGEGEEVNAMVIFLISSYFFANPQSSFFCHSFRHMHWPAS